MKKFQILSLFLLALVLNLSCTPTQDPDLVNPKAEKIDELLSLYAEYEMFSGAALIVYEGKIIYKNGFGLANREWDIPNTVDTKFRIASMTKSFTSMLVMQLVGENKLDLHKPISSYLPEYPKKQGDQITIHHLLTHSSGLGKEETEAGKKYNRPKDMVNQFANSPLEYTPGDRFDYSNSGYTLLGYILETITEKSYEELLQERIFDPLQMNNSGFYWHRPIIKNMASGYNKSYGEYLDTEETDKSTAYSAGAIYSTVGDMFLWDQALATDALLAKKYRDMFFEKHIVDPSYGGHYGYGWEFMDKRIGSTDDRLETLGHSGSINGFRSLYTKIPSSNSTILFFSNSSRAYLTSMTTAVTGILYDKEYDLPLIPLAKYMLKAIEKDGLKKGISFFKQRKDSVRYNVNEQDLIVAGYKFLQSDNAEFAAAVFKLCTEVFPDRDNPYDSYAEALMTLGKNDEAIVNFKKSLELNPNNNNAIEMLKKLGVTYSSDILKSKDTWGKELFAMPLNFAKNIELKGVEDARFPRGWSDSTDPYFWTYAFAWKVNLESEISLLQIEDYTKKYYDGLLSGVNKQKNFEVPKTLVNFTQNEDGSFVGTATIYDTFITTKSLELNYHIKQNICDNGKTSIVIFRVSPKKLDHPVWKDLREIKPRKGVCN